VAFDPIADYPLGTQRPDLVRAVIERRKPVFTGR